MKILSVFRIHFVPLILCLTLLTLSSCSSHRVSSSPRGGVQEEMERVEFEANLNEELAGLNRLHSWRTLRTDQQLRQADIDPALYDFPIVLNDQVQYYLDLFQGKQRKSFQIQLERSGMYMPYIKKELKKAGLPQDLAYLAMIESGYNPTICSSANACGMWQFIEGTGRNYKLAIDPWIDERREPEKATRAAIRYLTKLYGDFNDWHLAVAAYNAGEYRIAKALENYSAKNFWEVAESDGIYLETKRYVPKLIAAIIIARNPAKYGFTNINYMQPLQHELVNVPGGTDLQAVSTCSGTPVQELRRLNMELRRDQAPPIKGHYTLKVPTGKKKLVTANLHRLYPISSVAYLNHTVKKGENVGAICKRYGLSKKTLLSANKLRSPTAKLKQGTRLRIPSQTTKYVLLKEGERPEDLLARHSAPQPEQYASSLQAGNQGNSSQASSASGKKFYSVRPGDTLYQIAHIHSVSVQDLKQWNNLSAQATIHAGQRIAVGKALPVRQPAALSGVRIAMAPTLAAPTASAPHSIERSTPERSRIEPARSSQPNQLQAKQVRLAQISTQPAPQRSTRVEQQLAITPRATNSGTGTTRPVHTRKPAAIAHNTSTTVKDSTSMKAQAASSVQKASIWYVVQIGDSLWAIARKFQTTPQDLRHWNQLSSNDLRTGNKLIVKKM